MGFSLALHGLEAIMTKDMDVEIAARIAAGAFARDVMVSNSDSCHALPKEVVPTSPTALFFAALFIVIIFLTAPGVHFIMP
jgi:hypothetical protein